MTDADYTASKTAALGEPYPAAAQFFAAANDVNGDGVLDVLDCRLFKLLLQGKYIPD